MAQPLIWSAFVTECLLRLVKTLIGLIGLVNEDGGAQLD